MKFLSEKAQFCLNKKPSENVIQYLANISGVTQNVLSMHQQTDGSEKQVKKHMKEIVNKTIPKDAMKTFSSLKEIQNHASQEILSQLEDGLQILKEKI